MSNSGNRGENPEEIGVDVGAMLVPPGAWICRLLGHAPYYPWPEGSPAPHRVCKRCGANCADYWPGIVHGDSARAEEARREAARREQLARTQGGSQGHGA